MKNKKRYILPVAIACATSAAMLSGCSIVNTVTWKNFDGSVLYQQKGIFYGDPATYSGQTPTRPQDAQYTYEFKGWDIGFDEVKGDTTVTATYYSTLRSYKITFKNWDGSTLATTVVTYGLMPGYTGQTPTKPANAEFTYVFSGWDRALDKVTGEATYTAQFREVRNKYTVTWVNYDGSLLEVDENVEYGQTPTYNGKTPTKPADAQYTYSFKEWDKAISTVTGNVTYKATFSGTVNKYTVTWVNYDGTVLEVDENVPYGTKPTYDGATPTKPGIVTTEYSFKGWDKTIANVTGDATYVAQYNEIPQSTVAITYDFGGYVADNNPNPDCVRVGSNFDLQPAELKGYDFVGWYSDPEHEKPVSNVVELKNTMTIYGEFKLHDYSIFYIMNDGVNDAANPETVTCKDEVVLKDPTKTGYTFIKWVDVDNNTLTKLVNIYKDTVVKAIFEVNTYSITFEGNEVSKTVDIKYGSPMNLPKDHKLGYNFLGWKIKDSTEPGYVSGDYLFTDNITLVPDFEMATYNIEYELNGGIVSEEKPTYTVEDVALPTIEKEGYIFDGWSLNGKIVEDLTGVEGDIKLVAKFTATKCNITLVYDSTDETKTTTTEYDYDTELKLPTTSKVGYNFLGWKLNDKLLTNNNVVVKGDATYVAAFSDPIEYNIAYELNGGTLSTDKRVYTVEDYTLPTCEKEGYTFKGWTLNGKAVEDLKGLTGDVKLVANFEIKTFTITLELYGEEKQELKYVFDTKMKLPEPTRKGYNFIGWMQDGVKLEDTNITVREDATYVAIWSEACTYIIDIDLNGGAFPDGYVIPTEYTVEDEAITLPNPTKFGYEFTGFELDGQIISTKVEGVVSTVLAKGQYAKDLKLKAIYAPCAVEVTLDYDGGSLERKVEFKDGNVVVSTQYASMATSAEFVTLDDKEGYQFAGWNDWDKYTGEDPITEDLVLTAKWNKVDAKATAAVKVGEEAKIQVKGFNNRYYQFTALCDDTFEIRSTGNLDLKANVEGMTDYKNDISEEDKNFSMKLEVKAGTSYLIQVTAEDNAEGTAGLLITSPKGNKPSETIKAAEYVVETVTAYYEGTLDLTNYVPTKVGFVFAGWFTEDGVEFTSETVINALSPIKLVAHWTEA